MHQPLNKALIALAMVFIMVFSFFVLGTRLSSPQALAGTVRSIDEKTETVLKLTATATLASAAISAIPQDTATPIAEKLADFTEYFLLILCVLYTEKYLLTILGMAVFKILIPIACLVLLGGMFFKSSKASGKATKLAVKLGVVGLALYFLIPCSILVSDLIYDTYEASINTAIASAESLAGETDALEEESQNSGFLSSITGAVTRLRDKAAGILRQFVETLAILIVTSCLIPVLSLVFFLWLIRQLTGLQLPGRLGLITEHHRHGSAEADDAGPGRAGV